MLADDFVAAAPATPPPDPDPESGVGTMIFTSGTTGKPKGALRRARPGAEDTSAVRLIGLIGYTPDDVYLTSGPLYHSGPWGFMGGRAWRWARPSWCSGSSTRRTGCAWWTPTGSPRPSPLRRRSGWSVRCPRRSRKRYDRSSMKRMIANAAPWSYALKLQYLADFPEDSLWEVYGSTELGVDCVLEPKDQRRKPGSCGKPAPGVEVVLFDADGREVTGTGPDHTGELYVRSPGIYEEYYKQRDSYDKSRRGDLHTVGDIAYRDDEGYYYICDRKNDMIISGGMNIYPAEIEAALEQHPAIYEAAVFGIPSEDWGEAVHATVVRRARRRRCRRRT